VSDEIYGLLHHKNQHVSIARFYPEGTIISNGLSKWCGAGGWRLGTFSFPPKLSWLLDAMAVAASETFTSTCAPIQYAAIKAFEGGQFMEEYLKKVRNVLKITVKFITQRFDSLHILYPKPQGAFYIFPNFEYYRTQLNKAGIFNSAELCERLLRELGVALIPGVDFGMEAKDLSARLAYVDFDGEAALRAVDGYFENGLNNHREKELQFLKIYTPKIVSAIDKIEISLKKLSE
jgi:aspartate aminotransferase